MDYYAGIDLHSNNKVRNDVHTVLQVLRPYRECLRGSVVESTYNWYWLVDGLMEAGYQVHLANPSAIKQYEVKHADDTTDALHLANLLRLGILPEGYIYPKEERPVRYLLRKRLQLVQQCTAQILSFQNLLSRNLGRKMAAHAIRHLSEDDAADMVQQEHLILSAQASIATIRFLLSGYSSWKKQCRTLQSSRMNTSYY